MNSTKQRIRNFTLGILAGAVLAFGLSMIGGCSTVSGFAKDLGDTSEGIRNAMTK